MENKVTVFENEKFGTVRTVVINDEPWFVVADVCNYFGVTNRNRLMKELDEDEKGGTQMNTPGGNQMVSIVNEAGLYSLLFAMQPKKARGVSDEYIEERCSQLKAFKRWVTHEVIPSIRKHGMYATEDLIANPDLAIAAFTALKEEREKNALLTKTNQALVKETNTWDNRKLLNSLIRSYAAACCGGSFAMAWNNFYKTLLYKKEICVSSRVSKTGIKIDTLSKEELADAVQVAVAMCIDSNVQIDMILSHMPENN